MRLIQTVTLASLFVVPVAAAPQAPGDSASAVKDGGILAAGWTGKIDAREEQAGQTIRDTKLSEEGGALHARTGPAVTYWNPANVAKGNYTVKATFKEPKPLASTDHPHPYGIVIAGTSLDGSNRSYLYCAAYSNGNFIVRGFGPEPFQLNGPRPQPSPAVHKASATGEPVTQEIALSVKDSRVECAINGTVVGSYEKAAVVGPGRLTTTDGVYGLRFGHNTEALVTGLTMTTP